MARACCEIVVQNWESTLGKVRFTCCNKTTCQHLDCSTSSQLIIVSTLMSEPRTTFSAVTCDRLGGLIAARQMWGRSGLQRGPRSSTREVSDRLQLATRRVRRRQEMVKRRHHTATDRVEYAGAGSGDRHCRMASRATAPRFSGGGALTQWRSMHQRSCA